MNRRQLFKGLLIGAVAAPLFKMSEVVAAVALKCPQGAPKDAKVLKKLLDYKSKTAKRVAFTADAKDSKTHKKFKAGSNCANCKFYKAHKSEANYGKCAMVGNKYVPACGWCKSYRLNKKKA